MKLIQFTKKGIYCKQGGFYIDPWQAVEKAILTHGHADHAHWGHAHYLCHFLTKPILKERYGIDQQIETLNYNESIVINGVRVTLFPAGHILGSAQVRLEYKGEIVVISGDYKTEFDGLSTAFEPIRCHTFVSESTFGLPIYKWEPQELIFEQIVRWVEENQLRRKTSVLVAYSLGKAQRLMQHLADTFPMYVHSAIAHLNQAFKEAGVSLPESIKITPELHKEDLQKGLVIVPPAIADGKWIKSLIHPATGICSGWMAVRANRRWRSADAGFALSDHADWSGLLSAVKATGADNVFVTHGSTAVFSRYLNEIGIHAEEVKTHYGTEEEPIIPKDDEEGRKSG